MKVRARRWLVNDVVEPPAPGQQSLVRLSYLDDDAQGEHLDVPWEREVDAELDDTRIRKEHMEKQLDRLRTLMEDSKEAVGFSEEAFRDALSCSLELHGAEPLAQVASVDGRPPAFAFPALDKKSGADPTWSTTLDTLRPRRAKEQPEWEWRRQEIRPVVFQSPDHIERHRRPAAPGAPGRRGHAGRRGQVLRVDGVRS